VSAGTLGRRDQITRPTSARRNVGRSVRAGLSVLAGVMLYLTFEPIGWWWLAPVALAIQFVVLSGRSLRAALAYGVLLGWGLMVPLLWWTGEYVGPIGSLPLATLEAVLVAATCAAIAAISRLAAAPLWAALLWVAGEWLRSVFPFGGFAW
jgi:apolipoprotein N-acyltransferase